MSSKIFPSLDLNFIYIRYSPTISKSRITASNQQICRVDREAHVKEYSPDLGVIGSLLTQKVKEWVISAQLEKRYTKNEILTMYLNRFDWVNNAVGINSAANIYFNKKPKSN